MTRAEGAWRIGVDIGGTFTDGILWDATTGEPSRTLTGHRSWVNSVAFNSKGEWLVSGSSDGTVAVWSTTDGKRLQELDATKAEVRSVAVSPDGQHIAAGLRYGAVKVWGTKDWQVAQTWEHPADDAWSVAFSADSRGVYIAAGEWNRPSTITLRNIADGSVTRELKHPGEVLSLAVSRDGKTIAAGGGDRTVSVWRDRKP